VISCGFAGGLNPKFKSGTIVFDGGDAWLETALLTEGAIAARFHCTDRIATTAAEKRALRGSTGADAVEMESHMISAVCREQGIRFATVRVILDTAEEDLPLDFNRLMTPKQQMKYGRLVGELLKSPRKIRALLKLQKQSKAAAAVLARVLGRIMPA
jgi:adenosylhomocysteine nucleosidase